MQILKGTLFFPAMMKNRSLAKTPQGHRLRWLRQRHFNKKMNGVHGLWIELWRPVTECTAVWQIGSKHRCSCVPPEEQYPGQPSEELNLWFFCFFLLWDIWIQQQSKCYNKRLSILTRNSLRWINFFFFPADSCLPTALNRAFLHYYKVPHSQTIRSVPAHFFDNENGGYNTGPFRVPIHLFRFEVVLLVLKHFCPVRFTMMFL